MLTRELIQLVIGKFYNIVIDLGKVIFLKCCPLLN